MRILTFMAAAWMIGWSGPAFCDDGADDFPPSILHDPSLATSVYFPPSAATAGTAALGALSGAGARLLPCTGTNPCAVVTPAADSEKPAR